MIGMSHRDKMIYVLRSRLKYKLLLVCLLIYVLQCGMIVYSYQNAAQDIKAEMIDQNMKLLNQANRNYFSNVILEINRLMERAFVESIFWENNSLANEDKDYINENAKIDQILSSIYSYGSYADSVYLYFNRNRHLYIMDEFSHKDIPSAGAQNTFAIENPDLNKYTWYKGALQSRGNLYLSENLNIRESANTGTGKLLNFSKSLFNPLKKDELISVISINIGYEYFDRLARELCKPEEKLVIVSGDGTVIYSTDSREIFHPADEALLAKLKTAKTSGHADMPGRQSVLLFNQSESSGWYMVKEIPNRVLMEDVRRNAATNVILLIGIFVISIILMLFIAIRTTNPIKTIAYAMEKFEEGNGKLQTYLHRIDEIGKLNRSFNKMTDKINYLINSEYKAKIDEKQARLEALQAQINPHFLNNTLQIVSGIAVEHQIDSIEKISGALSTILRYSLSRNNELVTLSQELNNVEQYLFIQKFRYEDRLDYRVDIDPSLLGCHMPVLTLQPLVENAIKHGMESRMGTGIIRIYNETDERGGCLLVVEDNGTGISAAEADKWNRKFGGEAREENSGWNGRGLLNIHDRIRYYFGEEFGLWVESGSGQGFKVMIRLPGQINTSADGPDTGREAWPE
ncbi:cache domain-containing sensor histidine kinase [Cohnella caldifontis]|uniref:cache domain-containing sensor histidine kinase n=1 Tax=Cohnella caldifontis TaxID=3027471 RepID=UPI0023EC296C|nr:sensor histidine kinase [Cohnella sp. YIM B05605]